MNITVEELTTRLNEAEAAHAKYELTLGKRDVNWAAWYARFIVEQWERMKNEERVD